MLLVRHLPGVPVRVDDAGVADALVPPLHKVPGIVVHRYPVQNKLVVKICT